MIKYFLKIAEPNAAELLVELCFLTLSELLLFKPSPTNTFRYYPPAPVALSPNKCGSEPHGSGAYPAQVCLTRRRQARSDSCIVCPPVIGVGVTREMTFDTPTAVLITTQKDSTVSGSRSTNQYFKIIFYSCYLIIF